ncbi:hypothetical protein L873DRAFT_1824844 [Choiromyces venosus 120613-1]|uniref:Cupredoxin n=1 Tax=Choiromyces venosus 120613-1 TaxID=1336337 RepID=A0A3N4KA15_9PEZI|nr:hypothetical protein L873DRAFT_1824844 [Choiromyces venosus 120613-1]
MRYSKFAAAVAAVALPQFASAVAAPDKVYTFTCADTIDTLTVTKTVTLDVKPVGSLITTYYAGGDGPTLTITADNQKVTSVDKSIKTTSYHCTGSGVYIPPHQTKVWTVYEPTWITYEVPCATAYIFPYKEATCNTCTKNVEVIVYINIDIITYSEQAWEVIDGSTTTEIKTVTATPSYITDYLPPSTATPVDKPAQTHTVKVGGLNGTTPILKYNPEYVADVKAGDVVLFDFLANNHTVTESTFDAPCVPKAGGIDSSFRPNKENTPGKVTFPVTVTDDKPRWFYCAQPGGGKPHCQAGMVFAINAPKTGDKTLEAFKKLAAAVPVPGAPSTTTTGTSNTTSAPSTTTTGTPNTTGAPAATHTVKVGGLNGTTPILRYNPEYVADVKAGDVVLFDFLANNHTVTESTFDAPCVPKAGGIDSSFRPNKENTPGKVTFPVTVTDDKPRWFYCAQPGGGKPHCQAGMVFAINAPKIDSSFRPNKENTPGKVTFPVTVTDDKPRWFYCAQPGGGKPHCQAGMVFAINAPKTGNKTLDAFKKLAAAVPVNGAPSPTTTATTTSVSPTGVPTTPGGPAVTHSVKVGGLTDDVTILKYDPEFVNAKSGDVIRFDILAANHTVTESSFDAPCVPNGGIDSSFRPNKANIPGAQLFTVDVRDEKPKWFYCAQPGNGKPHCQAGMVFAINPPTSGNTLAAFKAKAAAVPVR